LGTRTKRPAKRATKAATKTTLARSDKDDVLAAAQRLEAAVARGNRAAVDRMLARDFSFIDAAGQTHSRARVLGGLKAAPRPGTARLKIKTYGRVALVTGATKSAQAGERSDLFGVDVWIKDDKGWRALIHHNNVLAAPDAPQSQHGSQTPRPRDAKPPACDNPLKSLPYKPKSQAERDILAAFQTLEGAVTRNDADEWVKHMADEFVVYRTKQHPTTKAERADFIRSLATINAETFVAEVAWMKLWVLGDAAVMRADHVMPGNRRPPYRATRLWVKRDGRWQMAMSQQTTMTE
jgi:ketosteroid isomerase-like protein